MQEAQAAREVYSFEKMDFDGYALMWGDKHRCAMRVWERRRDPNAAESSYGRVPLAQHAYAGGVRPTLPELEAAAAVQLCVQHLRLLP